MESQLIEDRLVEAHQRYLTHSPGHAQPRTLYIGKLDFQDLRVACESRPHLPSVELHKILADPPPPPTWRGVPIFVADCNRGFKFSPT